MLPHDFLRKWIPDNGNYRLFCEALIQQCQKTGHFTAIHQADQSTPRTKLQTLETLQSIHNLAETTECGKLRVIKTAPNLKCGWIISEPSVKEFTAKLDALYPEVIKDTTEYFEQSIEPTSFRDLLKNTQFANQITDAQINQIMRNTCFRGCLRRIAWGIDNQCEVSRLPAPQNSIPAVCNQACKPALSAASDLFD